MSIAAQLYEPPRWSPVCVHKGKKKDQVGRLQRNRRALGLNQRGVVTGANNRESLPAPGQRGEPWEATQRVLESCPSCIKFGASGGTV